jgi:hypothetical protein
LLTTLRITGCGFVSALPSSRSNIARMNPLVV